MAEILGLRAQILANAKIMLKSVHDPGDTINNGSQATLIPSNTNAISNLDVVVFGEQSQRQPGSEFTAALMIGLTPAIEGASAQNPEAAMHKLFTATCELLKTYIPKVGAHQRNIHGGGVFDEDMISAQMVEAQKKSARPSSP